MEWFCENDCHENEIYLDLWFLGVDTLICGESGLDDLSGVAGVACCSL